MADCVNPFFAPSTLPYQLPAFGEIRNEHYRPAFERGLAEQRAEIDAITRNPEAATFANTLIPLERSGQMLTRVAEVFFNRNASDADDFTAELDEELAPVLAAHADLIRLDSLLYQRIAAVHQTRASVEPALDEDAIYLVERYFTRYTLSGAGLRDTDKALLRDVNMELSTLTTRFDRNLLADTNELAVVIDDVAELDGLDASDISAAAEAARERGLDGKYLITLVLPTAHPYLSTLTNRGVRARVLAASRARGTRGGPNDNRALVLQITALRATRARLLGFATHAAAVTADETAKTPDAVADLLGRLAPAAARNARAEQAELQNIIDAGPDPFPLEAWDWAFYAEKLRAKTFDVDTIVLRPYFELERVLHDGIFFAATALYGVTFTERTDLVGWHPETRIFEVANADGSPVGLYIGDYYTRDSKRGGAWMNALTSQSTLLGSPTVVCNNLNVAKPAAGEATLLTFDQVTTLFHEFGHALHGLFARVTYPKFAGTNVHRDFVEFPSQVNEMWMLWPEVLTNFARHYETGDALPSAVAARIRASAAFNEGFLTSEYLAAALLDQAWHNIDTDTVVTDVDAFESAALASVGLDNPVVPTRYASTYFAHAFAGGYDAGYYSYIWSEVLDADTVQWFTENGGLTRANGDRFRQRLLGVGGSMDPLAAYRDFRGRDALIQPLLDRRGLN